MATRCLIPSSELWRAPYGLFQLLWPPPWLRVKRLDIAAIFFVFGEGIFEIEGSNYRAGSGARPTVTMSNSGGV